MHLWVSEEFRECCNGNFTEMLMIPITIENYLKEEIGDIAWLGERTIDLYQRDKDENE